MEILISKKDPDDIKINASARRIAGNAKSVISVDNTPVSNDNTDLKYETGTRV